MFSDQHRAYDLGCYGNKEISSPNFDALAKSGVMFTNCISNSPLCVPARGSFLTGLMPNMHRAINNDLPIDCSVESIADVMNRAAYNTGYIGKWHLAGGSRYAPIPHQKRLGFMEWKVSNCVHKYMDSFYFDENNNYHKIDKYEPIVQTDLAIEFITRNAGNPWGLVVSYGTPHDPYQDNLEEFINLYKDKDITLPPNVRKEPEHVFMREFPDHFMKATLDYDNLKRDLARYYAHITALDIQLGRLLAALRASGQDKNTIIVYTSDHGDMHGSHGFLNKQLPYAESVKVPLILCWDGVTVSHVSDEIISLVDIPVSVLNLAGLFFIGKTDGEDYSTLFTDKKAVGAKEAYIMDIIPGHQASWRGGSEWRGVKTKQYTYARNFDKSFEILYDDITDPYQLQVLDNNEIRAELETLTLALSDKYDEFLPWKEFIIKHGYLDEWNKSQVMFNLPQLNQQKTIY